VIYRVATSLLIGLALIFGTTKPASAQSPDAGAVAPELSEPALSEPDTPPTESGQQKQRWVIPPIRLWGSASYDMRREDGSGVALDSTLLTTQLSASTFLWQPWFAQVSGSLGLVTSALDTETSQQADTLTGSGRLYLLPMSRFPFEAWFDRNDSRSEAVLLDSQFVSTRWGLTQRYSPATGNTHYLATYEHAGQTRDDGGEDAFDALQLDVNGQRDLHSYQLNGRFTRNDGSGLDNSFEGLLGRHTWRRDDALSVETLANLNWVSNGSDGGGGSQTDSRFLQVNSFAIWRPNEKWLISGGGRVFDLLTENGTASNQAQSIAANAGASYQWSRLTRFNGTISLAQTENAGNAGLSSSQSLGVSHQPDPIPFGRYSYQWFTSAAVSNRTGEDASQHLSGQLSHSVDRSFELSSASSISLNLQQSLSGDVDSVASSANRIGHNVSLTWSRGKDGTTAYIRASGSDSRNLGGAEEVFQLLNLQASLTQISGSRSSWNGNLTLQGTRQITPDAPDGGFDVAASGDLSYLNTRFFGINRLRFISQYKVNDTRFSNRNSGQLTAISQNQESQSWENRMEYAIGRTNLSLGLRLAEVEGEARYLLQLKLTRFFGDL
jgi:hypothetical protein